MHDNSYAKRMWVSVVAINISSDNTLTWSSFEDKKGNIIMIWRRGYFSCKGIKIIVCMIVLIQKGRRVLELLSFQTSNNMFTDDSPSPEEKEEEEEALSDSKSLSTFFSQGLIIQSLLLSCYLSYFWGFFLVGWGGTIRFWIRRGIWHWVFSFSAVFFIIFGEYFWSLFGEYYLLFFGGVFFCVYSSLEEEKKLSK